MKIKPIKIKPTRMITLIAVLLAVVLVTACVADNSLREGDQAPEFSLPSSAGSMVSLDEVTSDGPALLYFHMAVG